jgi:site-specific recombinase XerD
VTVLLQQLPADEDANVVVVAMLTPTHAVDLFLGDLARRSRSESGRTVASYRRYLDHFTDSLRPGLDVTDLTPDDCRKFLDRYARKAPGYQATVHAILNSYFKWLYQQQRIKKNPLDHVTRPRRIASDALDVTTVTADDVRAMIAAAKGWTERLAVAIPAFTGARRRAVANLTLDDYNREAGKIRFREKGGKTVWKPIPAELRQLLDRAIDEEAITDYLVPSEAPRLRDGSRDDRVIWRAVKSAADRAGVNAHVHALRAAFAVNYLEAHKGDVEALKELMGHESIATTQTYLRRLDKDAAMERVRDLSWGVAAVDTEPPSGNQVFA